jgi:hypothetical protein
MIASLRGDSHARGDALHQLFMGRDTDEAEAAAQLLGDLIEALTQQHVVKK